MNSACSFIFKQISHFHKNGFALRLALKQRHRTTLKWPFQMKRFSLTKKWHKTPNFEGYFYTRGLLVAWLYRALYIL